MIIQREQVEQLSRIYNTMLEIRTKGEDTMIMSDCLRALEQVIQQVVKDNQNQQPAASDSVEEIVEE